MSEEYFTREQVERAFKRGKALSRPSTFENLLGTVLGTALVVCVFWIGYRSGSKSAAPASRVPTSTNWIGVEYQP